jgi:hypothetical protein
MTKSSTQTRHAHGLLGCVYIRGTYRGEGMLSLYCICLPATAEHDAQMHPHAVDAVAATVLQALPQASAM